MKTKIFIITMIFIFAITTLTTISNAQQQSATGGGGGTTVTEDRNQTINGIMSGAKNFISEADTNNTIDSEKLESTIDLTYNILLACGMVVAVVVGIVLGIQFMTSSVEGQAAVKQKLVPYLVGCVIIFGAFGIWKLVMVLMNLFEV